MYEYAPITALGIQTLKSHYYHHKPGPYGLILRTTLRTLQFIFAITTAAIYSIDLTHATSLHARAPSQWIYAETVAALSSITCILHCTVRVTRVWWCVWDGVLVVLWGAQVGVFGGIYFPTRMIREGGVTSDVGRMRAGVWAGVINMVLWVLTVVLGVGWCVRTRRVVRLVGKERRSRFSWTRIWGREKGRGDEEEGCGVLERGLVEVDDGKGIFQKGEDDASGDIKGKDLF
ncbi:hypothetical protein BDW59DRAFT_176169 [Aspergillus cavernicola]|uniref:MARVEL domain-containing protein n=1 Tax=Aspergillus cavernicola TaxID=176166 RepID=A0ABR4HJ40_9EURO